MDTFISYSSADKEAANVTKVALRDFGLTGFLAHEDLSVSEEWRDEIIERLKTATVFVALLSKHFKASEWCAQEVGFIVSRPDVLIMPLSLDGTVPFGFIAKLQSKRVHNDDDIPKLLRDVIFKKRPRLMIPRWIKKVEEAGSWRGAEAIVKPLVPYFASFTEDEAENFLVAALGNSQVWDAGDCRVDYLPAFARLHWPRLSSKTKKKFLKTLELTEDDIQAA
ncbi:toll/interleukin-1 receptor domain-containing protein [Horticoccus sp. 23ND18S-11]|uniref:toll/interleukin-1 receptor domain-containing protein n=1 Tax=Horticoccus sp. 23ND18S-11 TaxID=3391832 RepID=UPI0039C9D61F